MKNISKIFRYSKPMHPMMLGVALLVLITSILGLVSPVLSGRVVDEVVKGIDTGTPNYNLIWWLIGIAFAITFAETVLTSLSNRIGDYLSARIRKYLLHRFYLKILSLPQSYFDSEISGKISSQLARGITLVKDFTNTATNFILPMYLQAVLVVGILLFYNIFVGVFILILFPIYYFLTKKSTDEWGKLEEKKNVFEDQNRGRIQEVISNTKLVKSYMNEAPELEFVDQNVDESNKIYDKQSRTFHMYDFLRNLSLQIILTLTGIVIYFGAINGALSIGEIFAIIMYVNLARRPLFGMSFILTQIQSVESGSKEFFEIMDLESTENFKKLDKPIELESPEIEFQDISFAYEEDDKTLDGVSFKIGNHQKIGLVGHSGAGKSTIVNLILKFYKYDSGDILLSGKSYKELSHYDVRNNISLVMQRSYQCW